MPINVTDAPFCTMVAAPAPVIIVLGAVMLEEDALTELRAILPFNASTPPPVRLVAVVVVEAIVNVVGPRLGVKLGIPVDRFISGLYTTEVTLVVGVTLKKTALPITL